MATRTKEIALRGTVENLDLAAPMLNVAGDTVLIHRGSPRMLVMRCPCGCGDNLIINLDKRTGYAWRCYRNRRGLTLYPSYWREDGCRSHFIIWDSHIYWCSGWESDESDTWSVSDSIEETVLAALQKDHFIKYDELAEQLDLIPWEVLQACRQLVKQGIAISGKGKRSGEFRRCS
jgi:hypothetical protein